MSTQTRTLLPTPEAAKYVNRPERTLSQWRYLGKGPVYLRLEGAIRYDVADLDAWLDSGRVDPKAAVAS